MTWQVSNLSLSRTLKELGCPQESLWWWQNLDSWQVVDKLKANDVFMRNTERGIIIETYSAYTCAELGRMLLNIDKGVPCFHPKRKTWVYLLDSPEEGGKWIEADTEANARAKMLIHLYQHNLIGKEK